MRKPKRISFVVGALLFVSASFLGAQSNQLMDRMLEEKQATSGDAAYMILAASGLIPEDATPDQAMGIAAERKLLSGDRKATDPISLGEASYLIMETLGIRGGLLYAIFPGPRYAARELAYMQIVVGNTHAYRTVSGQEVLHMLSAALEKKGEKK